MLRLSKKSLWEHMQSHGTSLRKAMATKAPETLQLFYDNTVFVIVFTSQFEWKRQFGEEIEPTSTVFVEDQYISKRQESVKEN
ncbi:hypothetical protein Gogos_013337, partial [Gossypium gossypioides]|nr:hypothetical protein [Gossypium gossypioides]